MSEKVKVEELRLSGFKLEALEQKENENRKFRGIAYTGDVIPSHGWLSNLIIDLENVDFQGQIPIFKNHNSDQIVGFGSLSTDGTKLVVEGEIAKSSVYGKEVSDLNDDGFKWELSVGVTAEAIVEMGEEEKRVVNGRVLEGHHSIFKNPRITETSFVPVGADRNTNVSLFSRFFKGKNKREEFELELINETISEEEMKENEKLKEENLALKEALASYKRKEETEKLEGKFEGLELDEEVKELLISAFLSGSEKEELLAELYLGALAAKGEGTEEAEPGLEDEDVGALEDETEEEEKEKAELERKKREEALANAPEELFVEDEADETYTSAANNESLEAIASTLMKSEKGLSKEDALLRAYLIKKQKSE